MHVARTVPVTAPPRCQLSPPTRCIPARLGITLLLLFAASAAAQQAPNDLGQASLEELGSIQVYGASKHLQSASDAPASVSIVTADEIQKYGYRTLADILESVRGFYITYDRDYTFIGVRGFGRLGDWNSRILLLVDGHRINNNIDGQAMIGTEFLVDVDLIEIRSSSPNCVAICRDWWRSASRILNLPGSSSFCDGKRKDLPLRVEGEHSPCIL